MSTFAPAFRNGAAAPPHEVRPEWLRRSGDPAWAHLSMRITQRSAEWFKILQNFSRKNLVVWKRGCNFATLFRRRNPEAKRSEHWKIYNSDEVVQERTADLRVCENLLCQYPRHNTLRQKPGQEINHSGFVRSLLWCGRTISWKPSVCVADAIRNNFRNKEKKRITTTKSLILAQDER